MTTHPIAPRLQALGAFFVAALVLAGCDAADPTPTSAADSPLANAAAKSDVCHYDANAGTYHLISVADASLPAHLAHGDAGPGEAVPGQPSYFFDEACVPQVVFFHLVKTGASCTLIPIDDESAIATVSIEYWAEATGPLTGQLYKDDAFYSSVTPSDGMASISLTLSSGATQLRLVVIGPQESISHTCSLTF